ncbi:hypothetical protein KBX35_11435 [Micromonospora sp. C32]|uniref:hypothetical protein n=1 Tax=unclassified Micromonospora TaxID=2617518 RepID=UPI001B376281|nr:MULTISPECIES: hypothetical protein [unclassified Micromonospora]MBQ1045457.1 hypothetical protein [Micromonospora sp. C72]MBQ1055394.1 hypothetical protein [Micromonospora sp. C32]
MRVQRISVPLAVRPVAPTGEQKAPGWTDPWTVPVDGFVVRGALVVRFGAGLGVVRFGFGRGVGRAVAVCGDGSADRVVGGADGESVGTATFEADEWAAGGGPALRAVADEAALIDAGFSSVAPPTAASPPPQQHSTSTPPDTITAFVPPESRRHQDCVGIGPDLCGNGLVTPHSLLAPSMIAIGQLARFASTVGDAYRQSVGMLSRPMGARPQSTHRRSPIGRRDTTRRTPSVCRSSGVTDAERSWKISAPMRAEIFQDLRVGSVER